MNYRLVVRSIGVMLVLIALAMVACLALSYIMPSGASHYSGKALTGWQISIAITAAAAFACIAFGHQARGAEMLRKDAIGIVGIGWFACSLFAALPFVFCEPRLSFDQAYFEAVSGLTTTGASVFEDLSQIPETLLFWRSLTQWIGGIGILAMFVLVLARLGASGRSLFQTESSAHMKEIIGSRMRETVRALWVLYSVITVACALGLFVLGMTPFQALNHAMTTVSTGGFGTENDSINSFGPAIRIWLIAFMALCGISFPLILVLSRKGRNWKILKRHEETWGYVILLTAAFAALLLDRHLADGLAQDGDSPVVDTVFNAVSISTTTGFSVGDYDLWPKASRGILLLLMIIGGCSGSTAGGLKVSRVILWFKMLRIEIRRAYRPNEVIGLRMNAKPVPEGTRGQLFVIATSAAVVVAAGSMFLVGFEPSRTVDGCVGAVISSVANVGPAFNEFGPTDNFANLSPPSMVMLSMLMIIGRLEYIAVLVLFSRMLWRRY